CGGGQLSRADYRLARTVSARSAAGADDAPDPRLGPRVAALADPPRPARGGAAARAVQISAQRRSRLSDRPVADERRRTGLVGSDIVAAIAQDPAVGSRLSDDVGRRVGLRRTCLLQLPA